jgi:hypothetical protein
MARGVPMTKGQESDFLHAIKLRFRAKMILESIPASA